MLTPLLRKKIRFLVDVLNHWHSLLIAYRNCLESIINETRHPQHSPESPLNSSGMGSRHQRVLQSPPGDPNGQADLKTGGLTSRPDIAEEQ